MVFCMEKKQQNEFQFCKIERQRLHCYYGNERRIDS